jgi:hypothetical protein
MLKVFVNVTIGIGEVIHKSKADARLVSWGFISFMFVLGLMIRQKKTAMQTLCMVVFYRSISSIT